MKILSIVVTHNALRNNWLYKCLDSLLKSEKKTDIIVIDNRSTDDTCAIIKDKYPEVILIENGENRGFGQANNQGLEYGIRNGYDYFFLLNQDATIESNCIKKLIEKAEESSEYGILSPMHFNSVGTSLDFNFSCYITPQKCANLYSDYVVKNVKDEIYESDFICAAAWLLTKKSVEIVGGFSPIFFHYGEDDNYVHRLKFKGLKIGVYPNAKIFHDREKRRINHFFGQFIQRDKVFFLENSNPNRKEYMDVDLKSHKKELLKNKILLKLKKNQELREKISFLKMHKDTIIANRMLSMSNEKFIFLNI